MNSILMLAAAATIAASPIQGVEVKQVVVPVRASELASPAGLRTVRARISHAIDEVCGAYASSHSWQWPMIDDCRAAAKESSERRLTQLRGDGDIRLVVR